MSQVVSTGTLQAGQSREGQWRQGATPPAFHPSEMPPLLHRVREPLHVVRHPQFGALGLALGGEVVSGQPLQGDAYQHAGTLPSIYPEWLGDPTFLAAHGVRFSYVVGEMANGIATPEMVIQAARAGLIGFFGAGGLGRERVEAGVDAIQKALAGTNLPWGANLIHSPNEPALEESSAELYLRRGVHRVSASAFMNLTPSVVRYACSGLRRGPHGEVVRTHHVFAKVSRPEVAEKFMSPPPAAMLQELVAQGKITPEEAELAARLPLAEDITAEADSGGHTDNRPLTALLPDLMLLRDRLVRRFGYDTPIRIGAAGGLGTPAAVAAAYALGAAYVLTGSVNQAALESGLSPEGKRILAEAGLADVSMAPAADMFELGVKVQVLRRGTFFAQRALQLYALYKEYESLEAIPDAVRARLEKDVFRAPISEIWETTRAFWERRDPAQKAKAERDPKHRMALVFRWYLGMASRWSIEGEETRVSDYQIWCGPAMGAFNTWAEGSFLAAVEHRSVRQIAYNLLEGAAVVTRAQQARSAGVPVSQAAFDFRPIAFA